MNTKRFKLTMIVDVADDLEVGLETRLANTLGSTIIDVHKEEIPVKYRVEGKDVVDQNFYTIQEAKKYAESLHQKGYSCTLYQAMINCPTVKVITYHGDPNAD